MDKPTYEIAPEQYPISTCAIKHTVNKLQDSSDGSILGTERIGSAWGKAAESLEHISTDETLFPNCRILAGKQFVVPAPC